MAEIYVGSNFPARTTIFYAGELYVSEGPVNVQVYDITEDPTIFPPVDPENLVIQLTATQLEVDPGTYQVVLPLNLTTTQRKFKLDWLYMVGSETITHTSYLDVVKPYADITEIMHDLNLGYEPSDPNYRSYHELVMAEKYARKTIENFTGQKFHLYEDVHVVYGSGSDTLPLPQKLNSLHKLYANDVLLIDNLNNINNWNFQTVVSETGFGIRVDRTSALDNTVYTANGLVPPSINDYTPGAFKNNVRYRVVGKFGWNSVPDDVQQSAIQLAGHYFAKDRVWADRYLKNVSTFDWDFEFKDEAYSGTGCAYSDKLLSDYVVDTVLLI
jgi:hypothetical protein